MDLQPGDKLVVRGWKWDAETLRQSAEVSYRQQVEEGVADPEYSVSVFASAEPLPDGFDLDTEKRKLVAELLNQPRNTRWAAFTSESRLTAEGFMLHQSEPLPYHHDLVLGKQLRTDVLSTLESIFKEQPREKAS